MPSASNESDFVVIGGGFYGCCLSLFLRSLSPRVTLIEAAPELMTRASRVNQARIHTGFHYPRSILTAVKSMVLHERFARDFPDAVSRNFDMLYAIARLRSKVSAKRFERMFIDMGAPISPARPSEFALFDERTIAGVFRCSEWAFNYKVLRDSLAARLEQAKIDLRMPCVAEAIQDSPSAAEVHLSDGRSVRAKFIFNVTYSRINDMLSRADLPRAELKHELTEIALIEPPRELAGFGVTVMDGPFFSVMPYPATDLYSLTHVRYTPHESWADHTSPRTALGAPGDQETESRVRYMIHDSQRYLPCLTEAQWQRSLFEVKTVLIKNERDDGRPILYQRRPQESRVISILGSKIDNIYDLFDLIRQTEPAWAAANDSYLLGRSQ